MNLFHERHRHPLGDYVPGIVDITMGWVGYAMQKLVDRRHRRRYHAGILIGANMVDPSDFLTKTHSANIASEVEFCWSNGAKNMVFTTDVVLMTMNGGSPRDPSPLKRRGESSGEESNESSDNDDPLVGPEAAVAVDAADAEDDTVEVLQAARASMASAAATDAAEAASIAASAAEAAASTAEAAANATTAAEEAVNIARVAAGLAPSHWRRS